MQTNDILNLVGLFLNIIGSLLLSFSLSRYLTSMHGALYIHDKQIRSIVNQENRILNADVANLLRTGIENSRTRTWCGIVFVLLGFVIQLIPYIINIFFRK